MAGWRVARRRAGVAVAVCDHQFGPAAGAGRLAGPGQPGPDFLLRVVAISSMSAETNAIQACRPSANLRESAAPWRERAGGGCARHGCARTLSRRPGLWRRPGTGSLSPIARRATRTRLLPLPQGRGLREPAHGDDIAQALLAALARPASAGMIVLIGGWRAPACQRDVRARPPQLCNTTPPLPRRPGCSGWGSMASPRRVVRWRGWETTWSPTTASLHRLLHHATTVFVPTPRCGCRRCGSAAARRDGLRSITGAAASPASPRNPPAFICAPGWQAG